MTVKIDAVRKDEWIEMFPYGLAVGPYEARPVMIFKDKTERRVLPVWMSPVDAGIAMSQKDTGPSPHRLTLKLLKELGVTLEKCFFKEVRGSYQFVELEFSGNEKLTSLEARADEVLSFCLSTDSQYYCKTEFMEQCRVLEGEMVMSMGQGVRNHNQHPYLN